MILIYVSKITSRKEYIFKHIFKRLLQQDYELTTDIQKFVGHKGVKLSYGNKPLGNELYIWSYGLLDENSIEIHDINQCKWNGMPAFFTAPKSSNIPFDIFSSTFYLITRYEEYLPQVKDDLGRYDPVESIAVKGNFLQLPIVDIWAQFLLAKINEVFQESLSRSRQATTTVSIETTFLRKYNWRGLIANLRTFLIHVQSLRLKHAVQQLMILLGFYPDPFENEDYILERLSHYSGKRRSLNDDPKQVVFFFNLGTGGFNNAFKNEKFVECMKHIADYVKVGLRFSERCDAGMMQEEAKRFERIFSRPLVKTMAANSKIEIPGHYKQLVDVDKIQDYSMGYVNMPGFRAGTSMPYYFYDLDYEVQTPLLIHPYALHYKSIEGRMLNGQKQIIEQIADRVREVSGDFIVMFDYRQFHNKRTTHVNRILDLILDNDL
jgi:hypothetical protein